MNGAVDTTAFKMIRAKITSFSLIREHINLHRLKNVCNQIDSNLYINIHIYKFIYTHTI